MPGHIELTRKHDNVKLTLPVDGLVASPNGKGCRVTSPYLGQVTKYDSKTGVSTGFHHRGVDVWEGYRQIQWLICQAKHRPLVAWSSERDQTAYRAWMKSFTNWDRPLYADMEPLDWYELLGVLGSDTDFDRVYDFLLEHGVPVKGRLPLMSPIQPVIDEQSVREAKGDVNDPAERSGPNNYELLQADTLEPVGPEYEGPVILVTDPSEDPRDKRNHAPQSIRE